ncbi:MAG: TetR family transcriptional regulator [Rhizobiaceae bacterium]|nr:TetR family transcriptional regulator [Rhizobiaceae bacterium]
MDKDKGGRAASRPATRANGDQTKEKILDAAEELFGDRTFDTVSLRDITQHAGVTLALASYHFGTKDNLFSAVVARRADILNQMRIERLNELEATGETDIGAYLDAFLRPLLTQALAEGGGWNSYVSLISKVAMTNRWHELVQVNFDETANLFVSRLRLLLPDHSEEALFRGFAFTLQLGLQVITQNRRVDSLSDGRFSGRDLARSYAAALRFTTAGLLGLAG